MTKLMICALALLASATASASAHVSIQAVELDPLYSSALERSPANAADAVDAVEQWPEDLGKDFVVSEPSDRAPASVRKSSPIQHKPQAVAKPLARRSRLPAAVSDGFELRVRYNKITTMFWVVKREDKFDLLFQNSAGSRASRSLNEESFKALQTVANRLPASESNLTKCREASMQMHQLVANKGERTTTLCVNDKTKAGEMMREISQSLAVLVK